MKNKLVALWHSAQTQLANNRGFTMIELLIVIAILGILAVAVLSAINPVEQINRGRDTGSRSDAEQLLSAIDRYNAFAGFYPWQTNPNDPTTVDLTVLNDPDVLADGGTPLCNVSDKLSDGGSTVGCTGSDELKITFFTRIFEPNYNHLMIYNSGTPGASTYICFAPKSKAFIDEANRRCGVAAAGLPADMTAISTEVCGDVDAPLICLP